MDAKSSRPSDIPADENRRHYSSQQEREEALRTDILKSCARFAKWDRAYAIEAFNRYDHELPWLELRRKT